MLTMLADFSFRSMSLGDILVAIVVIAACCALVWLALRQLDVQIPPWLVQVFWIVVVAIVVIGAIRLVLSL